MDKNEFRKQILQRRNLLTQTEVDEKSKQIINKIFRLKEYKMANNIMTYLDFRNEVKTNLLVTQALADGKYIYIPVVNKQDRSMTPSQIVNYPQDLVSGSYGILEPALDKIRPVLPGKLDLIIMPGVAFDPKGNRLGYGGGYYDRFLPRLRGDASTLALAFSFQVVPDLSPLMSSHDQRVQIIISEKCLIDCRS